VYHGTLLDNDGRKIHCAVKSLNSELHVTCLIARCYHNSKDNWGELINYSEMYFDKKRFLAAGSDLSLEQFQ